MLAESASSGDGIFVFLAIVAVSAYLAVIFYCMGRQSSENKWQNYLLRIKYAKLVINPETRSVAVVVLTPDEIATALKEGQYDEFKVDSGSQNPQA